jgi:hypothetical protein
MGTCITRDSLHVPQRLPDRLTERDSDILGGVVMIDVQVPFRLEHEIDAGMASQKIKHVIEKADPG